MNFELNVLHVHLYIHIFTSSLEVINPPNIKPYKSVIAAYDIWNSKTGAGMVFLIYCHIMYSIKHA